MVPWKILHSMVRQINLLANCRFKWSPKLSSQDEGLGPALSSGLLFHIQHPPFQRLSLIPPASQVFSSSGLINPVPSITSHETQESFSWEAWMLETYLSPSYLCSREVSCQYSMNPFLVGNIDIYTETELRLLSHISNQHLSFASLIN